MRSTRSTGTGDSEHGESRREEAGKRDAAGRRAPDIRRLAEAVLTAARKPDKKTKKSKKKAAKKAERKLSKIPGQKAAK